MDTLAAMQVFVRVVETGGLSAAGRALGLAPSSVSRRISELEDMLGVRLLQRTTRRLSLTEAGGTYYERARDIVQAVEEVNLAMTEKRSGPSGILRITVPASVAHLHVAPAIAAFNAEYPAVKVVMSVTDRIVDIVGEGLDVAIRTGRLDDTSLIARKVGEARRMVCAAPSYFKHAGRPKLPDELSDHACLTFRSHPGVNLWRFGGSGQTIEVRATGPFFSDDAQSLVAAASAGLGLVLVPEWLVAEEIGQGRLVQVLAEYPPDPAVTPLYALFPPGPYLAPKIRAFIDFLAERFLGGCVWSAPR